MVTYFRYIGIFMFSFFIPSVECKDNRIFIKGLNTKILNHYITKYYKTSRVSNSIFQNVKPNSFFVHEFFALEFYKILEVLTRLRIYGLPVRKLEHVKKKLKELTWLSNLDRHITGRLDLDRLKNMVYEPLPFQMRFLEKYNTELTRYGLNGILLAATAGSGKTYTSLAVGECLDAEVIIVICPKNAVYRVWEDNIKTVFKEEQTYWISDTDKPYNNERIMVFHYEDLEEAIGLLGTIKNKKSLIILDESHNMNEIKTLRTQRFVKFCQDSKTENIIFASGTSFKASAIESIPFFRAIDKLFNEEVQDLFKKMYAGNNETSVQLLADRIDMVSFKVEKEELNLTKPKFMEFKVQIPNPTPFTLKSIAIEMAEYVKERREYYKEKKRDYSVFFYNCINNAYQRRLDQASWKDRANITKEHDLYLNNLKLVIQYADMGSFNVIVNEMASCNKYEKDNIIPYLTEPGYKERFKDIKSVIKYTSLKIQGECLGRILGKRRIEAHVEMAKHIKYKNVVDSTKKKTVVFTSFVEVLEAATDTIEKEGYSPLTVYAKTNKSLSSIVETFKDNNKLNPLVATFASLSTAVPLIMADTIMMINVPFRNYILEQAISRVHRLGQDSQTVVYTAVLDTGIEPNISSRNVDILKWSQDQVEKILGMDSPYKLDNAEEFDVSMESIVEDYATEITGAIPLSIDVDDLMISDVALEEIESPKLFKW